MLLFGKDNFTEINSIPDDSEISIRTPPPRRVRRSFVVITHLLVVLIFFIHIVRTHILVVLIFFICILYLYSGAALMVLPTSSCF